VLAAWGEYTTLFKSGMQDKGMKEVTYKDVSAVVISRAFFLFFPCNHIINIKKIIFFFRRSKRQRNF
jgi:hypothetical protein